jgi:hypothetical protein
MYYIYMYLNKTQTLRTKYNTAYSIYYIYM